MSRFRILALVLLVAESAARSPAAPPAPKPDPPDQVIAAVRASEAQAAGLAPTPAAAIRRTLVRADRLSGRVDPRLAERLLAR
jgi:hypothetical protein